MVKKSKVALLSLVTNMNRNSNRYEHITSNWTGKKDMTGKKVTVNYKVTRRGRQRILLALSSVLLLMFASTAYAAFFDTAGQTARPMGMGEVFLAQKGQSYWYNPASLANVENRCVDLSYGVLNPDVSSDLMKYQLSYVCAKGFAFGISGLGADGANEMVFSGAYGRQIGDRFALGGNVKVMRWAIEGQEDLYNGGTDDDLSKVAFSLDLSASYALGDMFGLADFTTGLYVKDAIMPNISESGEDDGKLPVEVGIGLMGERSGVTGELDVAFVNGETIFRGGAESGVAGSNLKVRGGVLYGSDFEDDTERTDFTFGVGYLFNSLVFDYAYNLPLELKESGGRHFVSFGVSF